MKLAIYCIVNLIALALNWISSGMGLEAGLAVRVLTVAVFFGSTWWVGLGRHFSMIQWYLFQAATAYGLWPILLLTYLIFIPDSFALEYALGELGEPINGLRAHDYIFTMLVVVNVTYLVCEATIKRNDESLYAFNAEALLARRQWITAISLAMIVVGTAFVVLIPRFPKSMGQIIVLFGWLRYWGMFYLVMLHLAAGRATRTLQFSTLVVACCGIGLSGMVGFIQAGQKGQLLVQLFIVFLLVFSYNYRRGLKVGIGCFVFMLCLVPFLPTINAMKLQLHDMALSGAGLGDRARLLTGGPSAKDSVLDSRYFTSAKDYFFVYLVNRVALTQMTATYVANYQGEKKGFKSLVLPMTSFVPRLFNPKKIDLDDYYNEIARTSGLGNWEDVETSRKPSMVDEAYYTAGMAGILTFGIFLGLLFYGVDRLARLRFFRPTVGLALIVALAVSNMYQYVGQIFSAMPYGVIYCVVVGVALNLVVAGMLNWNQPPTMQPAHTQAEERSRREQMFRRKPNMSLQSN